MANEVNIYTPRYLAEVVRQAQMCIRDRPT